MYVLAAALTLTFIYLPEHSCEGVVDDSGPRTGLYTPAACAGRLSSLPMSAIALACRTAGTGTVQSTSANKTLGCFACSPLHFYVVELRQLQTNG